MSKPTIQVAIDAANPYELARFWAAVTGYELEDHHDMIGEIIAAGYATLDDTIEIDGRRHWATASACRDADGRGPRLLFQKVPEPKTVKDRIHLDLHFGDGDRDAEIARIIALGATKLWDGRQGPQTWVTFADPEGNEFCVA
jgi:hypothetical protein